MGSIGSVIPLFLSLAGNGVLPITDERMTRFMITLKQGVELVWYALENMIGGEIYVKKTPSMKLTDIARSVLPDGQFENIGIRPGEKLHEQMIGLEDSPYTFEYPDHYKILPAINNWSSDPKRNFGGKLVAPNFVYRSDINEEWMSTETLSEWIEQNRNKIGCI